MLEPGKNSCNLGLCMCFSAITVRKAHPEQYIHSESTNDKNFLKCFKESFNAKGIVQFL
jgi:hypothetical protein